MGMKMKWHLYFLATIWTVLGFMIAQGDPSLNEKSLIPLAMLTILTIEVYKEK